MTLLSTEELIRYSRHFNLDQVGVEGQERLKNGSALLIGAGGLGSPLALYLAAAGVGRLGIVDFDVVDRTNLQRQILHGSAGVGKPKLESARARLRDMNPYIDLELHPVRLTSENALDLIAAYDVVADGADNFPTRYLVNDACVLTGKPLVSGSIQGFEGQLSVFNYRGGPCYRCLFPSPPPPGSVPSCAEGGVLGILPGVIGCLQATEVLKLLLEIGEPAAGRLLLYDALSLDFNQLRMERDPQCALCGDNPIITSLVDYEDFCGSGQTDNDPVVEIQPQELVGMLDKVLLVDVREAYERLICKIEPSLHVPLHRLADHPWPESGDRTMVTYCKTGIRSADAARRLHAQGFNDVRSLAGGMMAWIDRIDPRQEKY
ncbi:MAG: molybdopterin-synthase adenylyltransferase MoeB [Acidobacteriota bacterium]|nr:molybdopterin-synthase adenylyltransferase MoeB [Acidobacteriota bacterium]